MHSVKYERKLQTFKMEEVWNHSLYFLGFRELGTQTQKVLVNLPKIPQSYSNRTTSYFTAVYSFHYSLASLNGTLYAKLWELFFISPK